MRTTPYHANTHGLPSNWDIIVIGSGMGGMACAAALAKLGKKVLVLEQHYTAGGFTHSFSRKGFTFDVGVHCLGQMSEREEPGKILAWLTDGKLKMNAMGGTYETFHFPDGETFEFPDSREAFVQMLKARFPKEGPAIDHYFRIVREVTHGIRPLMLLKTLPQWVDEAARKLKPEILKYWKLTLREVMDSITTDSKLKAVLCSQWGYHGSPPSEASFGIHAMVVRHFWNGGYYPEGGSESIAEHLLGTVLANGGAVLTRASVDKILFQGGRTVGVRMDGGEKFSAKTVVSAAGARATVNRLLEPEQMQSSWAKSLADLPQSPPHVCLYLGLEGDAKKAGATVSNQWFIDNWDMDAPIWDPTKPNSKAQILYVSFPSLKTSHFSGPQGPGDAPKHTVEVVTFVPWDVFKKWEHTRRGKREPDYQAFKQQMENTLLSQMREKMPELMKLVVHHELSTPLSTTFFTRAPEGAIYGLAATPQRFTHPGLRARTPLKGLFMAGGDVVTLGVTGALMGGILAAAAIDPRLMVQLRKGSAARV